MAGCAFDRFDKETERIIIEEILLPQGEIEQAKPMRPRKIVADLSALLTVEGLKNWEGWKPFDDGGAERRYEFRPGETPTLGERIENAAYMTVQLGYIAGAGAVIAAPVFLAAMYFGRP